MLSSVMRGDRVGGLVGGLHGVVEDQSHVNGLVDGKIVVWCNPA